MFPSILIILYHLNARAAPASPSVEQLLTELRQRYQTVQRYQDRGSVVIEFVSDPDRRRSVRSFITAKDGTRFMLRMQIERGPFGQSPLMESQIVKSQEKFICTVGTQDREVCADWAAVQRSTPGALSYGLDGLTMPWLVSADSVSTLSELSSTNAHIRQAELFGNRYRVIQGTTTTLSNLEVWVSNGDGLVHRVVLEGLSPSMRYRAVFVFDPQTADKAFTEEEWQAIGTAKLQVLDTTPE